MAGGKPLVRQGGRTQQGNISIESVTGLSSALGAKVSDDDPRLSDSREWTASTVTQAEAEAGTSTTRRAWTAQRVAQAIGSLGLKIGTTSTTAAQGNDSRIVNSVQTNGNQTITGTKTFSSFPVTPSAAPTANYQAANKKYVDDSLIPVVNATPFPTPNTIMRRDEAGRVRVEAPVHDKDVANKKYVDGKSNLPPSMTGSITLNGTTNNTVVMTDIVTELELEIGDVIRIDTGAYNKLHTVESITNNNSIIVNYEHAGNRGNGSLKLPNFAGQATVTRIAKWFNAPIGLGQEWLDVGMAPHVPGAPPDVTVIRTPDTAYQNTTGRSIQINYSIGPGNLVEISNDAVNWFFAVWANPMADATTSTIIPSGCWWRATDYNSGAVPGRSVELR